MPAYTPDKSLENLANDIIRTHRPLLKPAKIAYVFRAEASISDDKVTHLAGQCTKIDDRNRVLHGYDFVIEIAEDVWNQATDDFRTALMDHELGHVGIRYDETGKPEYDQNTGRLKSYIRKHDVEEFEEILERHGAYHKKLREFLLAFAASRVKKKVPATPATPDKTV